MLAAILVFSATVSVVRGYCTQTSLPSATIINANIIMLLMVLMVLLLLLSGFCFFKQMPLYKLYLFTMVGVALLLAVAALLHLDNNYVSAIVGFLNELFNLIAWCLLAFFVFERRAGAIMVFGFGLGALTAGALAGRTVGVLLLAELNTASLVIVFVALAFLILLFAVFIFSEKSYDRIFASVDEYRLDLQSLAFMAAPVDKSRSEQNRPWIEACRRTGERSSCTSREMEVLIQLSQGRSPETIAQRLNISLNTVRTHTRSIYGKLDIHSHQELVAIVEAERKSLD
jgi:DNA-binding CsgD family transcriptional regulator